MASLQHKLDVILGPRRSLKDPDDLVPYATDESSEGPFLPDAVALVNSTEEIREVLRVGRRTVKGVTGLDLVALVVASEGTLAMIDEITLKLLPSPQAIATFLPKTRRPLCQSGGDRPDPARVPAPHPGVHGPPGAGPPAREGRLAHPPEAGAMLLVELDGDENSLEAQLLDAASTCEAAGAVEILVATDEARRRQIWDTRRNVNPVLKERHHFKFSKDAVVPQAAIPEMIRRLDALAAAQGVCIATFDHAGDGNPHVNVLFDDPGVETRLERILLAIIGTDWSWAGPSRGSTASG